MTARQGASSTWAHAKFGSGFRIELTYPTTLALSAAGKFEDFVCLI